MVHQLAETRQIVLFSEEREVRIWADQHLTEPEHRLVRLSGLR